VLSATDLDQCAVEVELEVGCHVDRRRSLPRHLVIDDLHRRWVTSEQEVQEACDPVPGAELVAQGKLDPDDLTDLEDVLPQASDDLARSTAVAFVPGQLERLPAAAKCCQGIGMPVSRGRVESCCLMR
jgi:hypothetical protein